MENLIESETDETESCDSETEGDIVIFNEKKDQDEEVQSKKSPLQFLSESMSMTRS